MSVIIIIASCFFNKLFQARQCLVFIMEWKSISEQDLWWWVFVNNHVYCFKLYLQQVGFITTDVYIHSLGKTFVSTRFKKLTFVS